MRFSTEIAVCPRSGTT